jgi:hypothetical protein
VDLVRDAVSVARTEEAAVLAAAGRGYGRGGYSPAPAASFSPAAVYSLYDRGGGCFSGDSLVTLGDGMTRIPMRELCGGMHVSALPLAPPALAGAAAAIDGAAVGATDLATAATMAAAAPAAAAVRVVAVLRRPADPASPVKLLRLTRSLRITPWHPVWVPAAAADADALAAAAAAGADALAAAAAAGATAPATCAVTELGRGGVWVFPAELTAEQRARLWSADMTTTDSRAAAGCEAAREGKFSPVAVDTCEDVYNVILEETQAGECQAHTPAGTAGRHAVLVGGVPCIALGHGVLPETAAQAGLSAASTATAPVDARRSYAPTATASDPDPHRVRAVLAHAYFGDRAAVLRDAAAAASAGQAAVFAAARHYPGQLTVGPAVRDQLTQLITGMEPRGAVDTCTGACCGSGDASTAAQFPRCGAAGELLCDASPELATA